MPKNSPKVVFKPNFQATRTSFFAVICHHLCLNVLQQFVPAVAFDGDRGFSHVWRGGSHWFHPRNCWHKKVLVLEIWKTAKNGEKSALFAIYFYQIHHFWYVFGHVIKQFFMPRNLVPFTCVPDLQEFDLSLISLVIFSPPIRHFSPLGQLLEALQTP